MSFDRHVNVGGLPFCITFEAYREGVQYDATANSITDIDNGVVGYTQFSAPQVPKGSLTLLRKLLLDAIAEDPSKLITGRVGVRMSFGSETNRGVSK